ncbi:hypothetical protein [Leptolyngbya sp. 7M]|uniref:hypothetical protein n=1 Tax=Leptolyngbya sp. 7M TaxID=2812896 RepID=UPI001B8C3BCA|nr:hypothetical protein [Leptolyngbya sp. 7M]QYO68232.1 hypothetical protein JVX88_16580 [Leptolyngbya sp. 7M]
MFDNSSNRNVSFCVQSQPLAQPEIDPTPSPYFPTVRQQTLLSQAKLEKENHLNRQTNLVDRIDYFGNTEALLVQNRISTEQVITPLKLNQQSGKAARQGQDSLTGLKQSQTIVASATASKLLGSSFDTTFGAKKYDHPKRTIIESTAAIKNLDWPCLSCCSIYDRYSRPETRDQRSQLT